MKYLFITLLTLLAFANADQDGPKDGDKTAITDKKEDSADQKDPDSQQTTDKKGGDDGMVIDHGGSDQPSAPFLPSTDGKSFSADFKRIQHGHYAAYIKLGDFSDGELPVWMSTQDYKIGVITSGCSKCKIEGGKVWKNRFTKSNEVIDHVILTDYITMSDDS